MLTFKQELHNMTADEYPLHIITFRLPYATQRKSRGGRVKVLLAGEELNVELAVQKIFENVGYSVLKGDGVHLAGHVITEKFMGINDNDTFKNWARHYGYGSKDLSDILVKSHEYLESFMMAEPKSESNLLSNLVQRWDIYYTPVQEKKKEIRILVDFWKSNIDILRRWVNYYMQLSYDPGGAPDLFLWNRNNGRWCWMEVKSKGDSINKKQWAWIQQFISQVAENVAIAQVLPSNVEDLSKTRAIELHLDRAAEDLRKLYKMEADKVCKGYEKTKNIDTLAENNYGVNPNCLLFFLKKTKNIGTDTGYDEKKLWGGDRYFGMKEYLARLESEWHELKPVEVSPEVNKQNKEIVEKLNKETEKEEPTSTVKETNLCADCWLSGDCEREKKAKRAREIIANCRGYFGRDK